MHYLKGCITKILIDRVVAGYASTLQNHGNEALDEGDTILSGGVEKQLCITLRYSQQHLADPCKQGELGVGEENIVTEGLSLHSTQVW